MKKLHLSDDEEIIYSQTCFIQKRLLLYQLIFVFILIATIPNLIACIRTNAETNNILVCPLVFLIIEWKLFLFGTLVLFIFIFVSYGIWPISFTLTNKRLFWDSINAVNGFACELPVKDIKEVKLTKILGLDNLSLKLRRDSSNEYKRDLPLAKCNRILYTEINKVITKTQNNYEAIAYRPTEINFTERLKRVMIHLLLGLILLTLLLLSHYFTGINEYLTSPPSRKTVYKIASTLDFLFPNNEVSYCLRLHFQREFQETNTK